MIRDYNTYVIAGRSPRNIDPNQLHVAARDVEDSHRGLPIQDGHPCVFCADGDVLPDRNRAGQIVGTVRQDDLASRSRVCDSRYQVVAGLDVCRGQPPCDVQAGRLCM